MKILIASDAWLPQVNGVVRTLDTTRRELLRLGHEVRVVEPGQFLNFPCTVYPEIKIAVPETQEVQDLIGEFQPDAIHVATEGPIGWQVRRWCLNHRHRFSTSYHTRFPEYLRAYLKLPLAIGYRILRWFHSRSSSVMVSTPTLAKELRGWGFRKPIHRWSRGVDTEVFHPRRRTYPAAHRPILMYVGRVACEKNLEAFLKIRRPGTKYVVGDGPARAELEQQYSDAVFLGPLTGEKLAEAYANADVLVFPSRTDTFGLVMLEALASGVPVAAYPVQGPKDIIEPPGTGALHEDLGTAIEAALQTGRPEECVRLAQRYSWQRCTEQFLRNLVPATV